MRTGKSKQAVLAGAMVAISAQSALASTWNNGTDLWSTATAWSPNSVPGVGDLDAVVGGGQATVDNTYNLRDFDLTGGAIDGTTTGQLNVSTQFRFLGGSINSGAKLQSNGATVLGNSAVTLNNAGSLGFATSPSVYADAIFNNSGTVTLGANVSMQLPKASTTSGTYAGGTGSKLILQTTEASADPDHVLTGSARINTASLQVSKTNFQIQAGARITSTTLIDNFSIVSGEGSFNGSTHIASATMYPGQNFGDIGTLHFGSDLTLDTSPVYFADLKTTGTATSADLLDAAGPVSVSGLQLLANVADGSSSFVNGQRFVIIHSASGLVGSYTSMIDAPKNALNPYGFIETTDALGNELDFHVDITSTDIALVYTDSNPVPEPALLPIAMAAATICGVARRRRLS